MRITPQRILLIVLTVLIAGIGTPALAQGAPDPLATAMGGLTMKAFLDQLQSRVETIINQAQNAGTSLIVVAGGQVVTSIDIAEQQFSTDLQFQEQNLETAARNTLISLNTAVGDLEQNAANKAEDALNQAQQAIDSLPFANTDPKVRLFEPYMVIPPQPNGFVTFIVRGNFVDAMDPAYTPTLTIDGTTVTAEPGSFTLTFSVPANKIAFAQSLRTSVAQVDIPYNTECFLVFHCRSDAIFKTTIAELPPQPGTLVLSETVHSQHVVTVSKTSAVMEQDASHGDDPDHPQTATPDAGWQVDPASVSLQVLSTDGDNDTHSGNGNCSTPSAACWKITTIQHHCAWFVCPQGHDGQVTFRLSFNEFQTQNVTNTTQDNIPINWDGHPDRRTSGQLPMGWQLY